MSDAPAPRLAGLTGDFYRWLSEGELRVQQCDACGTPRHIPRVLCPRCGSGAWHWHRCAGAGHLLSWTTTHRVLHPAFTGVPFTVAVVELDEGPRLLAALPGTQESELRPGLPVQFVPHHGEPPVPAFRIQARP